MHISCPHLSETAMFESSCRPGLTGGPSHWLSLQNGGAEDNGKSWGASTESPHYFLACGLDQDRGSTNSQPCAFT